MPFLRGLRALTRERGLLLILDEIQTGIGRTGRLFGFEHAGVTPDIMTLAKGLGGGVPLAALVAHRDVCCFEYGDQGGTFCGNPLMAAVGCAVIEAVDAAGLSRARDARRATIWRSGCARCRARHGCGEVRGRACCWRSTSGATSRRRSPIGRWRAGLLINAPRPDSLRFMPALTVTDEEIDRMIDILDGVLAADARRVDRSQRCQSRACEGDRSDRSTRPNTPFAIWSGPAGLARSRRTMLTLGPMELMQNVEADANNHLSRAKLSVFVISYNRKALISACLAPLSFADELIVIDKSSTDGTAEIATRYAHRVITVPWSPTVEDTRAFALSRCTHDWILALDDDECLSEEAVAFIEQELLAPRAEIYGIAQRHYILGIHDERAYYWPEFQPRLFRRGAVDFVPTVHGGYVFRSACRYDVPPDQGVCVHHLSHGDVSEWVEKTNRYTSMPDRLRVERTSDDLIEFAHQRIDFWSRQTGDATPGDYPNAVALLRATYDMIDRLKVWEEEKRLDGRRALRNFAAAHAAHFGSSARGDGRSEIADPAAEGIGPACRRAGGRGSGAAQRPGESRSCPGRGRGCPGQAEMARTRAEATRDAAEAARNAARSRLASVDAAMEQMRASMSWRVTAPLRGFASRHPHFVRGVLAFIARHPWLGRDAILLVRNAWRLATLRPIVRRTSLVAATVDNSRRVRPPTPNPTSWFYVGDTLEWLAAHRHLTGVGKVTTEILAATLDGATGSRLAALRYAG